MRSRRGEGGRGSSSSSLPVQEDGAVRSALPASGLCCSHVLPHAQLAGSLFADQQLVAGDLWGAGQVGVRRGGGRGGSAGAPSMAHALRRESPRFFGYILASRGSLGHTASAHNVPSLGARQPAQRPQACPAPSHHLDVDAHLEALLNGLLGVVARGVKQRHQACGAGQGGPGAGAGACARGKVSCRAHTTPASGPASSRGWPQPHAPLGFPATRQGSEIFPEAARPGRQYRVSPILPPALAHHGSGTHRPSPTWCRQWRGRRPAPWRCPERGSRGWRTR